MDRYEQHLRAASVAMARLHDQLQRARLAAKTPDERGAATAIKARCVDPCEWLFALARDRSEAADIATTDL